MTFSLVLYPPLVPGQPLGNATVYDLNPDVTSLVWTTALPGGFGDLQVGMQRFSRTGGVEYGALERAVDVRPFGHVEVWAGSFLCFGGRIVLRDLSGGECRGFRALGYGLAALTDDVITSTDRTPSTSGVVFKQVLATRAPLLVFGGAYQDPGIAHAPADYAGQRPADMVNAMLTEGGSAGVAWDYWVYEGRVVNFAPRLPPAGPPSDPPDYAIPIDDRVTWQEDYSALAGGVVVAYTDLQSNQAVSTGRIADASFASRFGFARTIPISGGTLRAASATTYANTYLAINAVPQYAVQVRREQMRGLERPGGVDLPPWTVRSGQWLQSGDQPYVPIIRTQFDGMAGTLQCDAGQPLPDGANLVRDLARITSHVSRGTNPNTGSKA